MDANSKAAVEIGKAAVEIGNSVEVPETPSFSDNALIVQHESSVERTSPQDETATGGRDTTVEEAPFFLVGGRKSGRKITHPK